MYSLREQGEHRARLACARESAGLLRSTPVYLRTRGRPCSAAALTSFAMGPASPQPKSCTGAHRSKCPGPQAHTACWASRSDALDPIAQGCCTLTVIQEMNRAALVLGCWYSSSPAHQVARAVLPPPAQTARQRRASCAPSSRCSAPGKCGDTSQAELTHHVWQLRGAVEQLCRLSGSILWCLLHLLVQHPAMPEEPGSLVFMVTGNEGGHLSHSLGSCETWTRSERTPHSVQPQLYHLARQDQGYSYVSSCVVCLNGSQPIQVSGSHCLASKTSNLLWHMSSLALRKGREHGWCPHAQTPRKSK